MLCGFRVRKGIDAPGKSLTGWYGADVFHTFGQILAGISRMYAATGDVRCLNKANALFDGWVETVEDDGYYFYSKNTPYKAYTYEKMVGGLVDYHLFCNKTPKAMLMLEKITDWTTKNIRIREPFTENESAEWYTLGENLYRAYLITGNKKYSDLAENFAHTEYWEAVRNETQFEKTKSYHAYSMLNTFNSAAEAFRIKNDNKYLDEINAAFQLFYNTQTYVTGGFGANENIEEPQNIYSRFNYTPHTFEAHCCTWAAMKLCKSLVSFTGQAHYGDWIEALEINALLGSIPMTNEGGIQYNHNYNPAGAIKEHNWGEWTCCTGTRPQAMADIHNQIWFHDTKDLYLSLFIPSKLNWKGITLSLQSNYPEENDVRIKFEGKGRFTLKMRKPDWLTEKYSVKINGKAIDCKEDNGWVLVDNNWENGDVLTYTLPMTFKCVPAPGSTTYPAGIKYGPIAMCVKTTDNKYPPLELLTEDKKALTGEPVRFGFKNYLNCLLQPYYMFDKDEPYFMYLNPGSENMIWADKQGVKTGEWKAPWEVVVYYGLASEKAGDAIEVKFTGTGFIWRGWKNTNLGVAKVFIDGELTETLDMYNEKRTDFVWKKENLLRGTHAFRLEVTGTKNEKSTGTYVCHGHYFEKIP